jgi:RIO kinase 1
MSDENVTEHSVDWEKNDGQALLEDGPLLMWDDDPVGNDVKVEASNDEWAYKMADRMIKKLPGREGKDRRTEGEVFDHSTLMTLHKFLSSGVLKSLDHPISTGKEANVFRGTTPAGTHVAVKIYRTNTATFKHVLQYIQGDDRFQGVRGDKRALVFAWAQKEYRNLIRMREAGVDVPEPLKVLNNVLITEFIGTPEGAWPRLKQVGRLEKKQAERFWKKIRDDYATIHNKSLLIHGDISEYNILIQDADKPKKAIPRIIDVGQAVLNNHPMGWEFLDRDIHNIVAYFKRMRVDCSEEELKQLLVIPE